MGISRAIFNFRVFLLISLVSAVESTTFKEGFKQPVALNVLLVASPTAGHMHSLFALGEELVARGHNVTMSSMENWFEAGRKSKERGFNYISAGKFVVESEAEFRAGLLSQKEKHNSKNPFVFYQGLADTINSLKNFTDPHLTHLIENHDIRQWDIIVVDFLSATLSCYAYSKGVPFIAIADSTPTNLNQWSHPAFFSSRSSNLNFFGRLHSSMIYLLQVFTGFDYVYSFLRMGDSKPNMICKEVMSYSYPVQMFPVLVRTVIGLDYSQVLLPSTTHVGPLLSKHDKPLPTDLIQWLADKENKSVIYISMGSIVSIDSKMAKALVDGISQTRYSVIWALSKANQYILSDIDIDTKRYYISTWIPQVTLMQHSSIGIAIFHGGANGINEALKFGVPLIVIPQMADQYDWAMKVEAAGVGIQIPHLNLITTSRIKESIDKIDSGNYRHKAQKMKLIIESAGGVDKSSDLVEFYATVGYDHLLAAPVKYKWNWIQYYNIDVKLVLIFTLVISVLFLIKVCQFCCGCCCCRPKKDKQD